MVHGNVLLGGSSCIAPESFRLDRWQIFERSLTVYVRACTYMRLAVFEASSQASSCISKTLERTFLSNFLVSTRPLPCNVHIAI